MHVLYMVIIRPIEYLIEVMFTLSYRILGSAGGAIFGVSLLVSFLVLPLYLRADAIQEEEQAKQKKMESWRIHIRKHFSGDERYMIQNAYFTEQKYHPLYALKSTLSLMLQVPFFIAAYHYLSTLGLLQGNGFWIISDLGSPDGLIHIASVSINVLPVLMTLINIISALVYTRGFPVSQKIQPIVLALVFLLLLYPSPSGLVIYWTLNNLFSLAKNLVMKYVRNRKLFLCILFTFFSCSFLLYLILGGKINGALAQKDYESVMMYGLVVILLDIPMILCLMKKYTPKKQLLAACFNFKTDKKNSRLGFVVISIALVVLTGFIIPVATVHSSPLDFVNVFHYKSPLYFVFTTFCCMVGVFLLWSSIIYFVIPKDKRQVYVFVLECIFYGGLIDYMFFKPMNVSDLTDLLLWNPTWPRYERNTRMLNMAILFVAVVLIYIVMKKKSEWIAVTTFVVAIAMLTLGIYDVSGIVKSLRTVVTSDELASEDKIYRMSRNGKNVMVIMMDRAIGAYIPYIFDYKPELKEKFDGFTYYPNTASHGLVTRYGAPGVFGGYDYIPSEMNARSDEKLVDKHNEALKMMPRLFGENGYEVTVCDLPFANYNSLSDFSIYDDMSYVNAFHLAGEMSDGHTYTEVWELRERNFVFYSFYKIAPAFLQDEIYDNGDYLRPEETTANRISGFTDERRSMENMIENTIVDDEMGDSLLLYANCMTHDPVLLQLPDFELKTGVDNTGYDVGIPKTINGRTMDFGNEEGGLEHFQVNVVGMMLLADWFDKLREMGVYDNTRIIIVADHGWYIEQFDDMIFDNGVDAEAINPLLMVKDFGSSGFTVDDSFMTNADTPAIALEGIVEDPVNPYTGNQVDMSGKSDGADIVYSKNFNLIDATAFDTLDEPWYHVHDDIFKEENWISIESR